MGAAYRVRQGLSNLKAAMRPDDWAMVARHLSADEMALFRRMEPADQSHSVRVLRCLLARRVEDACLLKAALLHDVGKSRCRIGFLHRTAAVLLRLLFGDLPLFLAPGSRGRWRMPLYVIANHARIGAALLVRAGCPERVWRLVELHHLEPRGLGEIPDGAWVRRALADLRRADNQN